MVPLWLCGAALAAPEWQTDGELRYIGSLPPDLVVDADGTTVGQGAVLDERLRVGASVGLEQWRAETELDLGVGQIAGDVWDIPGEEDERRRWTTGAFGPDNWAARKALLGGRIGPVDVEGGLNTSQWGLGVVANDGVSDPLFGRSDGGDRVLRLRLASKPFRTAGSKAPPSPTGRAVVPASDGHVPITIVVAGDRVVADDTARWVDAEAAFQGILAVLYADRDGRRLGLYGVYRHQVDHTDLDELDRRLTQAWVGDLYGALPIGRLTLAAEAAGVAGHTERAQSYGSLDGLDIRSAGAAVQATAAWDSFDLVARGGWASGDGNADDDVSRAFTFDRNYDVGMVLFDEVAGSIAAASYAQISDPENAGVPSEGSEALVNEGAFASAAYGQPAVVVRLWDELSVKAGAMAAWSTAPIAEPFESFHAGGVPTNHLGEPTSGRFLGVEADWAVQLGHGGRPGGSAPSQLSLRPSLLVQGGHAWLSDDLGGGRADLYMVSGQVRW